MDEFKIVMDKLKSFGTEQNIKIYKRHGAKKQLFGVSFANLRKLVKEIKKNDKLAEKLWYSNNEDAMSLATIIVDGKKFDLEKADKWVKEIDFYPVADYFSKEVLLKSNDVMNIIQVFYENKDEWKGRIGWTLITLLAKKADLSDEFFISKIEIIKENIHNEKNRKKEAMNNALIAIGLRNEKLKNIALEGANIIGKVEIDHGDTSCQTFDPGEYILRVEKRRIKK